MIQLCHCFQMSNTEDPVLSIPTVATNIKPGNFYHHNTAYCVTPFLSSSHLPTAAKSLYGILSASQEQLLIPFGPCYRVQSWTRPGNILLVVPIFSCRHSLSRQCCKDFSVKHTEFLLA